MSKAFGKSYVPRSPERFAYDADGNLVSDARFEYAWDAENRLVAAIDRTAPTGGVRFVVSNAYDHASGRWLSRDPLEEEYDFENLYLFADNSPVIQCDYLGLRGAMSRTSRRMRRFPRVAGIEKRPVLRAPTSTIVDRYIPMQ